MAFAALDAVVLVRRGDQDLPMSIADLYARAWENPAAHNSLAPGDLVLRVELPAQPRRSAYLQVSEKASFDWALVSCAAAAKLEGGRLSRARVVLGAVANVPYQSPAANELLEGKVLDEALAAKAADLLLEKAQAQSQNGYKVPLARALVRRALLQLKG